MATPQRAGGSPAPGLIARPFLPEEFEEGCEDCGAPAGTYCRRGCPSGYSADDARSDAAHTHQRPSGKGRHHDG